MKNYKYYQRLRHTMDAMGVEVRDIAARIGRDRSWVSGALNRRIPPDCDRPIDFRRDEMYAILDEIGKPPELIGEFFPADPAVKIERRGAV